MNIHAYAVIIIIGVMFSIVLIPPDPVAHAHSSSFVSIDQENFEGFANGTTEPDLGENWTDVFGTGLGATSSLTITNATSSEGSNSLNMSSISGYDCFDHNLTVNQTAGVWNYSFWFWVPSSMPLENVICMGDGAGLGVSPISWASPGIMILTVVTEGGYEILMGSEGGTVWVSVGIYMPDSWNALLIQVNFTDQTYGVAMNQTEMPTNSTAWASISYSVVSTIEFEVVDAGSYLLIDDLRIGYDESAPSLPVIAPNIISAPPVQILIGNDYYYQVISDQTVNWNLTTNSTFLSMDANGLITGIPSSTDVGKIFSVNITCDNANGTAYQNYTLTCSFHTNPSPRGGSGQVDDSPWGLIFLGVIAILAVIVCIEIVRIWNGDALGGYRRRT